MSSSNRQTLLLCLLAVLLPTAAFAALRGAPRWRSFLDLRETADELRLDLASLPTPSGAVAGDEERVQRVEDRVEALRAERERCMPFAGPDDRRTLALELSNLAEESDLWLESRETTRGGRLAVRGARAVARHDVGSVFDDGDYVEAPAARTAATAALPTQANLASCLQSAPLSRHLERWTARGSFSALRTFLARLSELPYCVVVVHMEVERPPSTDEDTSPALLIRLTVAL